jgi:transposase InsO family protein
MDFITGLPVTANGYSAIFVVVDKLPCTENIDAKRTADLFVRHVFKDHGLPKEVISDRGHQFVGTFIKALYALLGSKQCLSTSYHPQSDGQSERMNRVLEETLRHYVSADMTNWDLYLPLCEFAVNTSYN